jgi:hypothetical protein
MANKYEKDLEGRTQGGVVEGKEWKWWWDGFIISFDLILILW